MCDGTLELDSTTLVWSIIIRAATIIWFGFSLQLCFIHYISQKIRNTFLVVHLNLLKLLSHRKPENRGYKGKAERCTNDVDAPKTIDLFVV